MDIDTIILIDEYMKWYKNDEHSKNEDYYKETLTFENLSQMNDKDLVSFFEEFAKDDGKIQSCGQRTAYKLSKGFIVYTEPENEQMIDSVYKIDNMNFNIFSIPLNKEISYIENALDNLVKKISTNELMN